MPAVHWEMTSSGVETMNIEPITGSRRPSRIGGRVMRGSGSVLQGVRIPECRRRPWASHFEGGLTVAVTVICGGSRSTVGGPPAHLPLGHHGRRHHHHPLVSREQPGSARPEVSPASIEGIGEVFGRAVGGGDRAAPHLAVDRVVSLPFPADTSPVGRRRR